MIFIHGLGKALELYEEDLKNMDTIKRNTTKIIYSRAPTQNITCFGGASDLSWFDVYYMPLNSSSDANTAYSMEEMIEGVISFSGILFP